MDREEIFINLKVLESLNKNQKLVSRGAFLNIEPNSIIPEFIRRWHRQDSRDEMMKKLNTIVNCAIHHIQHEMNMKKNAEKKELNGHSFENQNHSMIQTQQLLDTADVEQSTRASIVTNPMGAPKLGDHDMITYLQNALNGIKNLKETYATCSQTCARLDVIINKVNDLILETQNTEE